MSERTLEYNATLPVCIRCINLAKIVKILTSVVFYCGRKNQFIPTYH